jgi:alpha-mannosidase
VRCVPGGGAVTAAVPARVPFALVGTDEDHSVFLETIKRGDLDSDDGKRTIVLRLYEAYGGHASVVLQVNVPGVVAAYSTNLLEDDDGAEALVLEEPTAEAPLSGGRVVQLAFRGFEVKTVKLVLEKEG